jgi:hypothetical protein
MPRKEAGAWIDGEGSLWMFGGRQLGDLYHLDDLWKFDTKIQAWSKYSGKGKFNEKSERGPIKSSSKTNTPGSRSLTSCWTDVDGNLWLFGGLAYMPGQEVVAEFYSDLWKFDVKKAAWEWVSGKDKPNQAHQYNFKDPASKENLPMPRAAAASWYDASENRLFVYGGIGFDSSATIAGGLSDMRVYTVGKDRWERIAGDSNINIENNISNPVSEDKGNQPGWRISSMCWKGPDNKLYLAGGQSSFTPEQRGGNG